MSKEEKVSLSNEVVVTINDRRVTVRKLGLISYTKMTGALRELIASLIDLFQSQEQFRTQVITSPAEKNYAFAEVIASLVERNIEQIITLLNIAVPDLEREYIENYVGLDDTIILFDAILRANNINKVVNEGKKLIAGLVQAKI